MKLKSEKMKSNEVIRAKQKIQALVNNQEDLILTVGVSCEILHVVLALLTLSLTHSLFSLVFIVGAAVVFPGIVFKVKEYEAETGERSAWLHDDY